MNNAETDAGANESLTVRSGRIVFPDRLQRLVIGGVLMAMTVCGLQDGFGWKKIIALSLQIELLLTAVAGWCPFYWSCSVPSRKHEDE